jgi:hypothetical protein
VLAFEVKPALIACDNVAKMGSLHSLQRPKKTTAFCDHHLPQVVCQRVWDPVKMKIFHFQQIMHTTQDGCGRHAQGLGERVRRRERFRLQEYNNFCVEMIVGRTKSEIYALRLYRIEIEGFHFVSSQVIGT